MKKQLSVFLTVVLAFGLAVAAYAYNQPNTTPRLTKAECCKNSDSCPMKGKTAEKSSCCDKTDCCKGGNCAKMKENGGNASPDNCPMKKNKQSQSPAVSTDGQNSCDGCDCCNGGDCCKKSKTS